MIENVRSGLQSTAVKVSTVRVNVQNRLCLNNNFDALLFFFGTSTELFNNISFIREPRELRPVVI